MDMDGTQARPTLPSRPLEKTQSSAAADYYLKIGVSACTTL